MSNYKTKNILGIDFYIDSIEKLLELLNKEGGLLVAPAAPNLAVMDKTPTYRKSIKNADYVITDSGYLLLLWKILKKEQLPRLSGLGFLQALFVDPSFKSSKTFWLMPNERESEHNKKWLEETGSINENSQFQVAPFYQDKENVIDEKLLKSLEEYKADYIIINIGGGTQESLGFWLKDNLSYSPAIICTGAAIAFMSGLQANIPNWADRLCLGWLLRCLNKPKAFIPRYMKAFRLFKLLISDT